MRCRLLCSYSNFSLALHASPLPNNCTSYAVAVTNSGPLDGSEVVQAYFAPRSDVRLSNPAPLPLRQLFDFERVHVRAGATDTTVTFAVCDETTALVDGAGDIVSAPGTYDITFTNGAGQSVAATIGKSAAERVVERFPGSSAAA